MRRYRTHHLFFPPDGHWRRGRPFEESSRWEEGEESCLFFSEVTKEEENEAHGCLEREEREKEDCSPSPLPLERSIVFVTTTVAERGDVVLYYYYHVQDIEESLATLFSCTVLSLELIPKLFFIKRHNVYRH